MIISASRRTDIPAFFSEWFFEKLKQGFVDVPNPMNPKQIRKVDLSIENVDCIVFWTKNPAKMLSRLTELAGYNFYFQYTLNGYNQIFEPDVPALKDRIETFKRLSDLIGPERIKWRYDPIFLSEDIDSNFHKVKFDYLAKSLKEFTNECTISFLDNYRKSDKRLKPYSVRQLTGIEMIDIAKSIAEKALNINLQLYTCAEKIDLSEIGIKHGSCIDKTFIESITGKSLHIKKDKNQRAECGCSSSVDIGQYKSCGHSCLYCYAS